jgi:cytochrome c oxidase assembly protein subunit 15
VILQSRLSSTGAYHPWRHGFARLTAASTFVLIFVGGLVTSTGSSLSVPDWPLSYGQFFPPMVGGIFYEHGHRMVAGTVALLTAALAFWTWREEPRASVRRLAFCALGAVLLQAVLGGVTVLLRLPTIVSVSHAALAQAFFCLVTAVALTTSRGWIATAPVAPDDRLRILAFATTAAVYLQLLIGAVMRHTGAGLAIADFPLAQGRLVPSFDSVPVAIHFAHRLGALVVAALAFTTSGRIFGAHGAEPRLTRPAALMSALVLIQIALGGTIIWTQKSVLPTTSHVAVGAAILATSLVIALRSARHPAPVEAWQSIASVERASA